MYTYKISDDVDVLDARYPEGKLTYEANISMPQKIAFEKRLDSMIKKARQPFWVKAVRRIASIFI